MGYKYLITLCLCLCYGNISELGAQTSHRILKTLTTEEGLSSNKINDIVQDEDGFLWIATNDGLNRYDGTVVLQYFYQDSVNSIPNNYINCLIKLRGNYLAIGTEAGLSFYDSRRGVFRNFYFKMNNALDVFNNSIVKMEIDASGNLWAVSRNSIFIFDEDRRLKKIISSPFTEADAARQRLRFVEKIFPLSDGNMLLYLFNGWHICRRGSFDIIALDRTNYDVPLLYLKELVQRVHKKKEQYFPSANLFKVFSTYFISVKPGQDSLLLFDEKGIRHDQCFFPFNQYPFVSWTQHLVAMDSSRLLFLFHNYGLVEIRMNWERGKPQFAGLSSLLFESFEYKTALRDHDGYWWLATVNEGVQKLSPYKPVFNRQTLVSKSGAPVKYETVSLNRNNSNLWIATYGDGFFRRDLLTGRQEQFLMQVPRNDPWPNFIWNVRQVSADTVWLGTQAGLFWFCISRKKYGRVAGYPGKPSALDSVPVTTQFTDSRGWIWMGLGRGKGLCYFDPDKHVFRYFPGNDRSGYPLRYPTQITEDKKGNLWFTNDASSKLVHWNRGTAQFEMVSLPASLEPKISNLSAVYCENDSILWLGTVSSGLIRWNAVSGSAIMYGREKGLSDSHVSSIYKDGLERIWVVTKSALSCLDPQSGTFINYRSKDGLPVKYPTASFYYDSQDHCLYTGGTGAYFCFDPERLHPSPAPKKTIITSIKVNGKMHMLIGQPAEFSPRQNNITIDYTAVDLTRGPDINYAYQLIGEDTGWVMAGHQRQINFSRLAPGNYLFIVRTSPDHNSRNTDAASFRFSIRKPFTQTLTFYALLAIAMSSLFYGMYRFRIRQMARTEQVRSEISKNLHDEVGSTLTNISLGSLLAQKQMNRDSSVNRILERIYQDSQSVSETMREIVWSINPKIDTLGEAMPRMLLYASEVLEARDIAVSAEVAPGLDHVKLDMQSRRDLYLIFKEAVNNLAKYSAATHVNITMRLQGNRLTLVISDNGIGFDPSVTSAGNGLKNMKERAEKHHWDLNIQASPGTGTTITLQAAVA